MARSERVERLGEMAYGGKLNGVGSARLSRAEGRGKGEAAAERLRVAGAGCRLTAERSAPPSPRRRQAPLPPSPFPLLPARDKRALPCFTEWEGFEPSIGLFNPITV